MHASVLLSRPRLRLRQEIHVPGPGILKWTLWQYRSLGGKIFCVMMRTDTNQAYMYMSTPLVMRLPQSKVPSLFFESCCPAPCFLLPSEVVSFSAFFYDGVTAAWTVTSFSSTWSAFSLWFPLMSDICKEYSDENYMYRICTRTSTCTCTCTSYMYVQVCARVCLRY